MAQVIDGPWEAKNHLDEHKEMFDNLVRLLGDFENSVKSDPTIEVPMNENGVIKWKQLSIEFLLQWSLLNSQKITHQHKDPNE